MGWRDSSASCESQTFHQGSPHSLTSISRGAREKDWGQGQALREPPPTPQIPLSQEAQTSDPFGGAGLDLEFSKFDTGENLVRDLELGGLQRSEPGVACGIRGWEHRPLKPAPSLGWAALKEGGIREGDTEDCEVQRGKQMLSRALPPGGYRCVERAISISSSRSGGCLHRKSPGVLVRSPQIGEMQALDPPTCWVTWYKCPTSQPRFPHLNNEMIVQLSGSHTEIWRFPLSGRMERRGLDLSSPVK